MTSDKPNATQRYFEFIEDDGDAPNIQRDDSTRAGVEKSALGDDANQLLMEKIVDDVLMEMAWARVKANRGAPGPDGITVKDFPEWITSCWPDVRRQLLDGTYQPQAARRVTIDKPDGGTRELGIATFTGKSTPVQSAFGFRRNCSSVSSAV
jgi:hypothetical protein